MNFRANRIRTTLLGATFVLLGTSAWSQTLTVSSPQTNDFLGKNNQLKFSGDNINRQVKIVVVTTKVSDPTVNFRTEGLFDPNADHKIDSNLTYNFDDSAGTGLFNVKVDMFYANDLNTALQTVNINNVTIDTKAPKLRNVVPANGAFVNATVPIRATIDEPNVSTWKVQVNSRDIPNNNGSGNTINMNWDASLIETDGAQTISITVTDKGQNTANKSISVTLDRVKPDATVRSPTSITYRPNATIPVLVDIADQAQGAVQATGVKVYLRTMDGQLIQQVARMSARANGNGLQWTGRIKKTNRIPNKFQLVVGVVDRAGNVGVTQVVNVTYGG